MQYARKHPTTEQGNGDNSKLRLVAHGIKALVVAHRLLCVDRIDSSLGYFPENCRWVTPAENQRHKPNIKLNMAKANDIRLLVRAGMTRGEVAKVYGVSVTIVSNILLGKSWNDGDIEPFVGTAGRKSRKPADIARIKENINNTIKYLSFKEDGLIDAISDVFGE